MATIHSSKGNLHISIVAVLFCTFAVITLLYAETIASLSPSFLFGVRSCARRGDSISTSPKISKANAVEEDDIRPGMDDRFEFEPNECDVAQGKWVYNPSLQPLYTDKTCPYIDRQYTCGKNGRPDTDYLKWEWQPEDCVLPRFDPKIALEKLRGKRLMFTGDSLQRNQWQSFICSVESIIPEDLKSLRMGRSHSVFKAKEYNATIEFYWAPFLVESNTDNPILVDQKKRIIKVDSVSRHAKNWQGVDILAFNTYVWWMSARSVKLLWGSFGNGDQGTEELDTLIAYRLGLRTWANWIDSNVDPNKTRVFFTTMSPTHQSSREWGHEDGIKCFNETKPAMNRSVYGVGIDTRMMTVVKEVMQTMKVPVTFINVTQLSQYRVDGHLSIYSELGGKLLTDEQKADPLHFADCIHWCLPGVPDTWNRILFANL